MKVELKKLPKSEIEMTVELDPTEWGKFIDDATKEVAKEVKIDGFRPGNAPKDLVEKTAGKGRILEKAADMALQKTFPKAAQEQKVQIIGRPEVQIIKIAEGNPFEFKVRGAVMPEIKLADYKKIAQAIKPPKKEDLRVDEKEVVQALEWLQKSRTQYAGVDRPAQKNDRVEVDFVAKQDGQIIEKGESKNHPIILGEGAFVPGFEDNLIGMKAGEEKKFSLVFPKDFAQKTLAGQNVDFEAKLNLVQEAHAPELNDEFAKTLGKFESLAAVKQNIREGLLMEKEQKEKEIWRIKLLEEIAKKSEMELPDILVVSELDKMMDEFKFNIAQMGFEFNAYLNNIKKTEEELRKEWRPKAEDRVRAALVLDEISHKENIQVSDAEIEEEANRFLSQYPDLNGAKAQIDRERLKQYTEGRIRNEKVFNLLENL